jgi:hypothetical protein
MKNRKIALLVGVAIVMAVALAGTRLSFHSSAAKSAPNSTSSGSGISENKVDHSQGVPKHVAYGLFFGEMMALKKKAAEREKQGIKAEAMRNFHKSRAKLSDHESQVLDAVASDCNDKVVKLNDQARTIINRERARHPNGKLKDGEALPTPPADLLQLEDRRTQTLLDARERLRSMLGQKAFDRIDTFIQHDIEARTKGSPRRKDFER